MIQAKRCGFPALCVAALLGLTACGGGKSSATIGGTLSGLSSGQTVSLTNGSDSLTLNANGAFTFPTQVSSGNSYNVQIATRSPTSLTCTVGAGSGTVDTAGDAVTSVSIVCNSTAMVSGTVTGLGNGLGLILTLTDSTTGQSSQAAVAYTGSATIPFSFPTALNVNDNYTVLITNPPAASSGQTCVITSGATGIMTASGVPAVVVTCT